MSHNERESSVLIVDDVPENIQLISKILYEKGLNIMIAQSGREALSVVSRRLPDLILLDVTMPDMDGFEVCRQLQRREATSRLPVIFLTARTQEKDILKGFESGGVDYVTKPFNAPELLSRVLTHLDLKKSRDLIDEQYRRLESQNEELRDLNATKDRFFSIIAHDLKNPLGHLVMFADLLQEEAQKASADRLERYADAMCRAARQGYRLLESLLEWSRAQTGRISFEPRDLHLRSLVTEAAGVVMSHVNDKQIHLDIDIPQDFRLYADTYMLSTILRNLVSNAIKFSHEGGTIEVHAEKSQREVELTVRDHGVGIRKQDKDKLFRVDAHHSTLGTKQEKGTGLGLLLCKEFMETHGGSISVSSEVGEGSCFRIVFPLSAEEEAQEVHHT